MTQILSMPIRIGSAATPELITMLTKIMTSGEDHGPRGAQIRSLAHSLQHLLGALRITAEELLASIPPNDARTQDAQIALKSLEEELQQLIDLARSFPIDFA